MARVTFLASNNEEKARNERKKWTESAGTGRGLREEKETEEEKDESRHKQIEEPRETDRQTDREYRERKTENETGEKGGRPATKVRSQGEILCRILSIVAGASGFFNARDNEQTLRFSMHCQHKPSLYNVNTIREEWQEMRATNSKGKGKGWKSFGAKRTKWRRCTRAFACAAWKRHDNDGNVIPAGVSGWFSGMIVLVYLDNASSEELHTY